MQTLVNPTVFKVHIFLDIKHSHIVGVHLLSASQVVEWVTTHVYSRVFKISCVLRKFFHPYV
jgi:hypothetical protein